MLFLFFSGLCAQPLTVIRADQALKNQKDLRLSDFVESVELVALEGHRDAYFSNFSWIHWGEQYLMVGCNMANKVMLFSKEGKYLRQIGRKGHGPGEYDDIQCAAVDPTENYVVMADRRKVLLFTIGGEFIKSKDITHPILCFRDVQFLDRDHFVFTCIKKLPPPPVFPRMIVYNMDLDPVDFVLTSSDPDYLSYYAHQRISLLPNAYGMMYFEGAQDTVFEFRLGEKPVPRYYYDLGKHKVTGDLYSKKKLRHNEIYANYFQLWDVYDLPRHLVSYGSNQGETVLIWHDKNNNQTYSQAHRDLCDQPDGERRPYIENDIFGLEPLYFRHYDASQRLLFSEISLPFYMDRHDLDCLKDKSVSNTVMRDDLIRQVENIDGSENQILVIMHVK